MIFFVLFQMSSASDRKKQLVLWKGYGENTSPKSYRILESKNVLKVSIGARHVMFLTSDQEVYAVGSNNRRQLGIERCEVAVEPMLVTALLGKGISSIACGGVHSTACTVYGELFTWGSSEFGQCGTGVFDKDVQAPTFVKFTDPGLVCIKCKGVVPPDDDPKIIEVVAGDKHTLAIGEDSKLWGWGSSPQNGLRTNSCQPKVVEELVGAKIVAVAAGANHSAALCEKVTFIFGSLESVKNNEKHLIQ